MNEAKCRTEALVEECGGRGGILGGCFSVDGLESSLVRS